MNNLSRLLQEIKDNPVMYIDKPSITCLHSFLNGYLDAPIYLGLDREISGFEGFQDWIQERAKTQVCQSWSGIIIFGCGSERSAFYRFFELFEEFIKLKDISKIQECKEKYSATENNSRFSDFDIYDEILKGIKKRPGMFLGTSSITKLDMLLRGYSLGRREVGVPPTKPESEFSGFQSWIEEKYGIKTGQSWSKIILFYSIDEHEALQRFFELYEEYLNRNNHSEVDEKSG
ncbi:hypothetical protein PI95_002240 [Hassallia byssoidea VB512170]|uniref:Uncharacterized protein n=1 Tax=Hassallia byssoidea VB512170 TaxID=1304833 RepID=A0A846H0A9_9CYAN|nr:hypothetical protein [Hassalia byssoidea]NEU71427.1 hypothetical protein [Hassalia byssoidea VB512170]